MSTGIFPRRLADPPEELVGKKIGHITINVTDRGVSWCEIQMPSKGHVIRALRSTLEKVERGPENPSAIADTFGFSLQPKKLEDA